MTRKTNDRNEVFEKIATNFDIQRLVDNCIK